MKILILVVACTLSTLSFAEQIVTVGNIEPVRRFTYNFLLTGGDFQGRSCILGVCTEAGQTKRGALEATGQTCRFQAVRQTMDDGRVNFFLRLTIEGRLQTELLIRDGFESNQEPSTRVVQSGMVEDGVYTLTNATYRQSEYSEGALLKMVTNSNGKLASVSVLKEVAFAAGIQKSEFVCNFN